MQIIPPAFAMREVSGSGGAASMNTGHSGDAKWERKLNISTDAGDYEKEDANHCRYEPTSYAVLERLAGSGYMGRGNVLADYGCGKGRVSFFMNHALGMRTMGIEYDADLCRAACENLARYAGKHADEGRIAFIHANAEEYEPEEADCFYFFNPFSVKILNSVIGRIMESYYENPRAIRLFFYYAVDSYLTYLMTEDRISFEGEIDCRDLFHNDDHREKIMIFRVDGGV